MLVPLGLQALMVLLLLYQPLYALSILLGAANTILSVVAACWLALWLGLRVMIAQGRAILWTVLLVNGLPYVTIVAWSMLYRSVVMGMRSPGYATSSLFWLLGSLVPQLLTLLFYVWLIRLARRQLLSPLAAAEPIDPRLILPRALARIAAAVRPTRYWRAG